VTSGFQDEELGKEFSSYDSNKSTNKIQLLDVYVWLNMLRLLVQLYAPNDGQ
jgi:hypothetical protein